MPWATHGDTMKTWVSREDLHAGDLPAVCVVTGEDADGLVRFRFNSLPDWTWLLLLCGVIPFLIALMFASDEVRGEVPVRREVVERYHQRKRLSLIAGAAGIALLGLAVATAQAEVALMGVAAVVTAIGARVVAETGFVDGRPDRTGLWVKLSRVHPNFVEALRSRGQVPTDV